MSDDRHAGGKVPSWMPSWAPDPATLTYLRNVLTTALLIGALAYLASHVWRGSRPNVGTTATAAAGAAGT